MFCMPRNISCIKDSSFKNAPCVLSPLRTERNVPLSMLTTVLTQRRIFGSPLPLKGLQTQLSFPKNRCSINVLEDRRRELCDPSREHICRCGPNHGCVNDAQKCSPVSRKTELQYRRGIGYSVHTGDENILESEVLQRYFHSGPKLRCFVLVYPESKKFFLALHHVMYGQAGETALLATSGRLSLGHFTTRQSRYTTE